MKAPRAARVIRAMFAVSAVAAGLLLVAGCSSKPPAISRVLGRIVYVNDVKKGERTETLGVFLVATDPDGVEDLAAFYVINDEAELFWKVDRSAWTTSVAEGETWVGVTSLRMPGGSPFPAGSYRVVLQAVGGDTVEDTIVIPARTTTAAKASYPSAVISAGVIKVKGGAAAGSEIWVYGSDGGLAGAFPLAGRAPTLPVATVTATSPALAGGFTFRVFSWDPQEGYGVLTGPYSSGG